MGKLIRKSNFTQIPNSLILDEELSFKAKGVYAYLASKGDGWAFYISEIAKHSKDGKDSVRSALQELIDNKYLVRHKYNNKDTGQIEYNYEIFDTVDAKSPHRDLPQVVKPTLDKPAPINTIQYNNKDTISTPVVPIEKQAETIYKEYPRKVAKPNAIRAIIKQLKSGVDKDYLLNRTTLFADCTKEWDQRDIAFIPHPATWYNQERFNDDHNEWKRNKPKQQDWQKSSSDRQFDQISKLNAK
jgi:hypothetical protein